MSEPRQTFPPAAVVRRPLVFDIETIADLDDVGRAAIAPLAEKREWTVAEYASLCPPLARVASIAWYDIAAGHLVSAFDATLAPPGAVIPATFPVPDPVAGEPDCSARVLGCDGEAEVIAAFGAAVEAHLAQANGWLISFNGRGFDLPVLLHRGCRLSVERGLPLLLRAMRDHRYSPLCHIDLMDVVPFHGAGSRWPLAAYAVGYGARSPKTELDGAGVGDAVRAGRIVDVARYCASDVLATAFVYRRVERLIAFGTPR